MDEANECEWRKWVWMKNDECKEICVEKWERKNTLPFLFVVMIMCKFITNKLILA